MTKERDFTSKAGKIFISNNNLNTILDPTASDEYLKNFKLDRHYVFYVDIIEIEETRIYRKNTISLAYPLFIDSNNDLIKISRLIIKNVDSKKIFGSSTLSFRGIEFRILRPKDQLIVKTEEDWTNLLKEIGFSEKSQSDYKENTEIKFKDFF